jgi:HAD superfamily hydrolase (TIGR01549 family)
MKNSLSGKYSTLLFDLDGTLLDSFTVHYEVYEIMFAHFGIQITREAFLSSYSPNWYLTYEAMGLPKKHWEPANLIWVNEAEKRTPELFPGTLETLATLFEHYVLGLVTSGSKSRVIKDLGRTGIERFFKTIVTGDDIKEPKPSPEALELALRAIDKRPEEVVYIGDAYADYEMAKAAGVHFIGVSSAFASLRFDDPDYAIHPLTELPSLLGVHR